MFVDKAGGFWNDTWSAGHQQMMVDLGDIATSFKKQVYIRMFRTMISKLIEFIYLKNNL